MTATIAHLTIKDGNAAERLIDVVDRSGTGDGPFDPIHVPADPTGTPYSTGNPFPSNIVGAGAPGDSAPGLASNASGLIGWLRKIVDLLGGAGLAASGKTAVTNSFAATGTSAAFTPLAGRPFNVTLRGTFVGTVIIERCLDGANWDPLTAGGVPAFTYTGPCSESFEESEVGAQYRLRCTAYTSGTINYRISQ